MRIEQENPVTKEATFKASKKTKKKYKQKPKSYCSCSDDSKEDEEVANFVKRLKDGTEKYKGKLPLICFNCDSVGHFSNKCHYKKNKINEEEYDPKIKSKFKRVEDIKRSFSRKSFASRKTVPHQTKMKSTIVTHKGYYSWQYKTSMKKYPKKNMKRKKSIT